MPTGGKGEDNMTINGSINMTMRDPMIAKSDKRCKVVWCTDNGNRWNSATECAKEMGVSITAIHNTLNGKYNTCKGLHFSYAENVTETQSKMAQRINTMTSNLSELERKAALWDAYQKEQEVARKAEEERQQAIVKAKAKLERRERICGNAYNAYLLAEKRRAEAERELAELTK